MEVSDFDNNHDFPRACQGYPGHRDEPNQPMSPTERLMIIKRTLKNLQFLLPADAQCSR